MDDEFFSNKQAIQLGLLLQILRKWIDNQSPIESIHCLLRAHIYYILQRKKNWFYSSWTANSLANANATENAGRSEFREEKKSKKIDILEIVICAQKKN